MSLLSAVFTVSLMCRRQCFCFEELFPHLASMSLPEQGVMQGTIPYLGTFLTDLVMMDTAMKDYTEVRHSTCVF